MKIVWQEAASGPDQSQARCSCFYTAHTGSAAFPQGFVQALFAPEAAALSRFSVERVTANSLLYCCI